MKKLVFIVALLLIGGFTFGQKLKKGNLIGTHVITVELNPGVTMEQWIDYWSNELNPAFEKNFPGWKVYLTKGVRGENKNAYGMIYTIESEQDRDKYYNDDGTLNQTGKTAIEKMSSTIEGIRKLGKRTRTYTDWIVL